MGYLNCRKAGTNYCFSGNTYLFNSGTKKLHVRTKAGGSASDVLKYPLTSDTSASQYCPIHIRYSNSTLYLARTQILSNSVTVSKTVARGAQTTDSLPSSATSTRTLLGTTLSQTAVHSATRWSSQYHNRLEFDDDMTDIFTHTGTQIFGILVPHQSMRQLAYGFGKDAREIFDSDYPILNMAYSASSSYSNVYEPRIGFWTANFYDNIVYNSLATKFMATNKITASTTLKNNLAMIRCCYSDTLVENFYIGLLTTATRTTNKALTSCAVSVKLNSAIDSTNSSLSVYGATSGYMELKGNVTPGFTLSSQNGNSRTYKYHYISGAVSNDPFWGDTFLFGTQRVTATIKRSQQYTGHNANV